MNQVRLSCNNTVYKIQKQGHFARESSALLSSFAIKPPMQSIPYAFLHALVTV